jgi:hypothetical protein
MSPKTRETILTCPKPDCNKEGFLRKKYSNFRIPQKNEIDTYYDLLEYISALYFNDFSKNLSKNDGTELTDLSIEQYNSFFTFYNASKNQLEEFELNAIKSIIQKYSENFNILFSKDLQESNHTKDIIYHYKLSNNQTQKNKVIFLTREKLLFLYSSIIITALQRCSERHILGIEQDFEKEMVEKLKSVFYYLTLNLDKRNRLGIDFKVVIDKYKNNFELKIDISKPAKLYNICSNCKAEYPPNYISKCKCGFRVTSRKSSKKYEKIKREELNQIESNFKEGMCYFGNFMTVIQKQWFDKSEIKRDFQQYFDNAIHEILEELEMPGKINYSIVHKEKGKPRYECYISEESDFMKISIKLNEYTTLIKKLVQAEVYGIGNYSEKVDSKLIETLRRLNFPERYLLSKINLDYNKFREYYAKVQLGRMLFECINLTINTIGNPLKYNNDPEKFKSDIESIPHICINMIINKKLIPKDEIDKYNIEVDKYKIKNQEIPKEILFKSFPVAGFIDSTNKDMLSSYKLDLLR